MVHNIKFICVRFSDEFVFADIKVGEVRYEIWRGGGGRPTLLLSSKDYIYVHVSLRKDAGCGDRRGYAFQFLYT